MNPVLQSPFQAKNPPLRSLTLPSLRGLFESLLSAAPLGVPNAVAFAPLGYAVRFRPTLFACANRLVQKLTTHYATLFMNPWHGVPISRGFENQHYQAPICIGSSIETPLEHWIFPMLSISRTFQRQKIAHQKTIGVYWKTTNSIDQKIELTMDSH
jgi:hypothetical protein